MAAADARPIPQKNVAYRVTFPIFDADGDLVTGATGLDSEVSKDGGTFTDCTNEATEIATSSGMYYLDLTSTEMNADTVAIIVKTSTSGAKTTPIVMYPEEAGDVRVNVTQVSGDSTAADTLELFVEALDQATGQLDSGSLAASTITASSIASDAITAAKLASDVTTEIQSGLATASALSTVDSKIDTIDTNVDSILADTNELQGDWANGGRLDNILDSRASQTSVDTIDDLLDTEVAAILADTNELQTDLTNGGRLDLLIDAIKAKTDNLPSDPADASDIASSFSTVNTKLDTIDDLLDTEVSAILADTNELQTDLTNGGRLDLLIDAIKAKTDNLPADPADASDITSSFTTVNTKLDTIDDLLDTEVGAIKTVTDKLDDTLEDDGGTYRFTTNALEQAPTGGSAPTAEQIADEVETRSLTVGTNNDKTGYGLADGAITAAKIATDAIDADALSADALAEINATVDTALADYDGPTHAELVSEINSVQSDIATVDTVVDAIKVQTDKLPDGVKKNTALASFMFVMIDSTDDVSGKTGLTVTATRSIDGAAFGACTNAVSEVSDGVYKIDLSADDLNGDVITLKFTATGANATIITIKTEA